MKNILLLAAVLIPTCSHARPMPDWHGHRIGLQTTHEYCSDWAKERRDPREAYLKCMRHTWGHSVDDFLADGK